MDDGSVQPAKPVRTEIALRDLLRGDPREFKLHCATFNGTDQPLDVFARSWEEWVGWSTWSPKADVFNRRFIFSVMQVYYENHETWLFGGIFEVLSSSGVKGGPSYKIALREDHLPGQIGRMKLRYLAPRNRRINLETALDKMEVIEILPHRFEGRPFPGHDSINVSLAELQVVVRQSRSDWRGALEHMKGVYVIHDKTSGKAYVGSAYNDTGIWSRWSQYAETLHGDNVDLRDLVEEKGPERVGEDLTFALLEFWSMRTSDAFVLEREKYWKDVLLSREFGHNLN